MPCGGNSFIASVENRAAVVSRIPVSAFNSTPLSRHGTTMMASEGILECESVDAASYLCFTRNAAWMGKAASVLI